MKLKALLVASLFLTFGLIGMVGASAAQDRDDRDNRGRVYSTEGAWYGIASIVGVGDMQTLDTFTSDAQREGREGTFLCTSQGLFKMPHPLHMGDSNYWTGMTNSAQGNWVRIDKNKYAFTAIRIVYDQNAVAFGWAKFWGTITPISNDEYTGTLNYQFYYLDGTPYWPTRVGSLHSHRVPITFE
jgi:hypothetical protein